MKIITTGTGYGYPFNKKGENYESEILYTYDTEGNLYMSEGEVEARLQKQYYHAGHDLWFDEEYDDHVISHELGYKTRSVYIICASAKQEKETQGDIIDKMIEIMPCKLSVYAISYIKEAMQIWADNQLKLSNLIDRDKVIELIDRLEKAGYLRPESKRMLITKIKEL